MPKEKKHTLRNILLVLLVSILTILISTYFIAGNYFFEYAMKRTDKSFLENNPDLQNDASGTGDDEISFINDPKIQNWYNNTPTRDEEVISFDGLKLVGTSFLHKNNTKKWMIVVHGYSSKKEHMYDRAKAFYEQGFNILAVDCRGCGQSEGEYITMGWYDRLDVATWANKIATQIPDSQIVLHGLSMGGTTVMLACSEELNENVKCVVEDCGYSNLWDEFSYQLENIFGLPPVPIMNALNTVTKIRLGFKITDINATEKLKNAKIPIMFIHGDKDGFVPFEMVHDIYNATPTEKNIYIAENATHASAFVTNPNKYINKCIDFINKFVV